MSRSDWYRTFVVTVAVSRGPGVGPRTVERLDLRRGQGHSGKRAPRRVGHHQERQLRAVTGRDDGRRRTIPGDGPRSRFLHGVGNARGVQDRHDENIRVAPGQPVAIPLPLEIGQLEETVVVTSSSELINTQIATVAATLNSDQLTRMPTPTRNALNAVAFLPGVNVDRNQPRLDHQRPARELPEHHRRRREQQRQLPAQHGRVLRLRHPTAGRDRSRVGDAFRGRGPTRRRRRCRDHGVPDAVGGQPLHRQRGSRYLPEPEFQLELRLQRDQTISRRMT